MPLGVNSPLDPKYIQLYKPKKDPEIKKTIPNNNPRLLKDIFIIK